MIFAFGFGPPWLSILLLIATGTISYGIYRLSRPKRQDSDMNRAELRRYFYQQRQKARDMAEKFDLTDDEIESKIDDITGDKKN